MSSVAMKRSRALHPPGVRLAREAGIALIGMAFVVCALLANHSWFERHFLPTFFAPFEVYTVGVQVGRIVVAGLGAALLRHVRPRFGQFVERRSARQLAADVARIAVAVVLALGMSEWALRHTVFALAAEDTSPEVEPKRQRDPWLGWKFAPSRTGREQSDARVTKYAIDANGYRVRRADEGVDFERPRILFSGESIIVGHV